MAVPVMCDPCARRAYLAQHVPLAQVYADRIKAQTPIPEGAMRVAPGSDAVVWKVNPGKTGEL